MNTPKPLATNYMGGLPVVFVHTGTSFYTNFTFRQASVSNPDSPVHLIGDCDTSGLPLVQTTPVHELIDDSFRSFTEHYQHSSPNNQAYELFCFQRWFLLRALMDRYGYERAFMADSDVMIYAKLAPFFAHVSDNPWLAAFNIGVDCDWVHSASGHSSCWTRAGIDAFCQLLLDLYQQPAQMMRLEAIRQNELLNNQTQGISDMTALYLFYQDHTAEVVNLSKNNRGVVFDHNISMALNYDHDEYQFWHGQKKILRLENGYPLCYNLIRQQSVRMGTLHFQGNAKNLIHRYYTGQGVYQLRVYRGIRLHVRNIYYRTRSLRRQLSVIRPIPPVKFILNTFNGYSRQ